MQEQQCFLLCLSCSIRKGRQKDSILQHNLCFYINTKGNMNPEGLQASAAKWQDSVKVNVSFSFQSSFNSRLPIIAFTTEQQTPFYWTWAFPVYLIIYLLFRLTGKYFFPFIDSFEDFESIPVEARKEKPPQGIHLRQEHFGCFYNPMAPIILLLKKLARDTYDFTEVYPGVWHRAFDLAQQQHS